MWDRLLFALRRPFVDVGQRLASTRLSIVLMVLLAQYYLLLAIWSGSSPPHVVSNIAATIPFWLLYGLLLVNTGACLWYRLPRLRRDISVEPRLGGRPADWEIAVPASVDSRRAPALVRRLGYRPFVEGEHRVHGVRRRWAALGSYLFHGAFFLLAAGFLLTFLGRQEATIRVAVGEDYAARPDQLVALSPPRALAAGVPNVPFRLERIRPEFWRDELLFTALDAELVWNDGGRATTRINRPLWVGPGTFLRLSGFGYTPLYELSNRDGDVVDSAFVKLNVFPPGQRDYFSLPGYPHRLYVEVLPDPELIDGAARSRSLNLVDPAIRLEVARGRLDLGGALLGPEDGFEFEGLTLRFPEIRYWGDFSVVRDPGFPIVVLGYAIGLAGLLLKLRGRRVEVTWSAGEGGRGGVLLGRGGPRPDIRNLEPR